MKIKNITRYTYDTTAFQGWRLNICRNSRQFTKYFSDKQFGSPEAPLQAALTMRNSIIDELKLRPTESEAIFARYR